MLKLNRALEFERKRRTHIREKKKQLETAMEGWEKIQGNTKSALETYAQTSCRTLCDKVRITFPQEVRDMIFRYLIVDWPEEQSYDDVWMVRDDLTTPVSSEVLHDIIRWKHLTRVEYMGIEAIKEIQYVFFKTTTFHIPEKITNILKFRTYDPLRLGIIPADHKVTVQLLVNCERYHFSGIVHRRRADWYGEGDRSAPSTLIMKLESLFSFHPGSKFIISLEICKDELENTNPSTVCKTQWSCLPSFLLFED